MKKCVNPYLFFLIQDGKIIVWNYRSHQQFELEDPEYFFRMLFWSRHETAEEKPIDKELKDAELLIEQPETSPSWGWDKLSEIFHMGTSDIAPQYLTITENEWIDDYLSHCKKMNVQDIPIMIPEGQRIFLPSPDLNALKNVSFQNVLLERKTCRSFNGQTTSLEDLSTLLYFSLGEIHGKWEDLEGNQLEVMGIRKAFPSGGGLHPEEAYITVLRVAGLDAGLYYYDAKNHSLIELKTGFFEDNLISLLYGQYYARGLSYGIFLTSRFDKSWWKYAHSRAYRVALLDIGHASQTILLTATALSHQTWLTGAFGDEQIIEYLNLASPHEKPLFFIGVGKGDNVSIDPHMLEHIKKTCSS